MNQLSFRCRFALNVLDHLPIFRLQLLIHRTSSPQGPSHVRKPTGKFRLPWIRPKRGSRPFRASAGPLECGIQESREKAPSLWLTRPPVFSKWWCNVLSFSRKLLELVQMASVAWGNGWETDGHSGVPLLFDHNPLLTLNHIICCTLSASNLQTEVYILLVL